MRISKRPVIALVVAAVGFGIWGSMQVLAFGGGAATPTPLTASAAAGSTGTEALGAPLKTYVNQSSDSEPVAAGFQAIDPPTSVVCAVPGVLRGGTCALEVDQNVQVSGSAPNNTWAICTKVDGSFVDQPNCPFLGLVPTSGYIAGSFQQTATGLSPGTHTVQTFLFTLAGGIRSIYTLTYRLHATS